MHLKREGLSARPGSFLGRDRAELGVSKGTAQRALAGLPKNLEPAAGANG